VPASSSTQYQLLRSPRSNPIVSLCREIFLPCFVGANLLHCRSPFSLCLERVDTWDRTASRRRPAFSSHLVSSTWPDY
jgi:hypothetical protein